MTQEEISKIENLLDDSLETIQDKKQFAKTQAQMLKECSEKNGLGKNGKSTLKRIMNYHHYKGVNWLAGNPLEKDPTIKDKDKVAPTFIKLAQIVDDLATIGDKDFLQPYLDALLKIGIKIEIDYGSANIKDDTQVILDTLDSVSKLQVNVDTLDTQLKEEKAVESEELGFAPKSGFLKVLGLYEKIKDDKADKAEDAINQGATDALLMSQAYTYLASQLPKGDSDDED